ncbi:MAG: LiaF-related protein [Bacteroidota bacterium]|nr:LiaF-related protein [Bacteroidota bacterium]
MENSDKDKQIRSRGRRVWIPLGLLILGGMLFLRQLGLDIPEWLFSWQLFLIGLGIFLGLAHGFRGPGWLILILIGSFFMMDQVIPGFDLHRFLWPVIIIVIALVMLIRPKKSHWGGDYWGDDCSNLRYRRARRWRDRFENRFGTGSVPGTGGPAGTNTGEAANRGFESRNFSSEDYISATTVLGGIHKNILSKNFKGGDITIFMGGAELNLSQADIQGTAALDITQIMGGTKIVVPPNWTIRSELTSVFGSLEDKRQNIGIPNPEKVLIIDGSSVFGGIEIRNY